MLRLLGHPLSNFYAIAKAALLEKGLDFAAERAVPSQDPVFLATSPLGRIPVLATPEGFLTETIAILGYLEELAPTPSLFPGTPYERACVRRLCHLVELGLDLPLRPFLAARLGGPAPAEPLAERSRQELARNAAGIARLARFSPWVVGEAFSAADLYLHYCLGMSAPVARQALGFDLEEALGVPARWREAVAARPAVQAVDREHRAALERRFGARGGGA
ncbi:MAG: glutathione S-transferase [Porticoccaceae bacterium]|nr:MAG: glutathione S-transferase [Porticoccaceae bacterium]